MGLSARAIEEASMEATTSSTSSNFVATLGNAATNHSENLNTTKFSPICSISEWTNEAQKMANVAILLYRGLQEKHASKVTVAEFNDKLDIEMAWPLIMSDMDVLDKFWKKKIEIPSDYSKSSSFHDFSRKLAKRTQILFFNW